MVRDRDKVCQNCQGKGSRRNKLTVHHIKPKAHGGSNNPDNCILLCLRCHRELHMLKDIQTQGVNL